MIINLNKNIKTMSATLIYGAILIVFYNEELRILLIEFIADLNRFSPFAYKN